MRAVVRELLLSPTFQAPENHWTRYSWPAEYVARAIKDVGWRGVPAGAALLPMANMGQQLLDPPHVGGWSVGAAWFSSGTMLARSNLAADLAASQRPVWQSQAAAFAETPESLLSYVTDTLTVRPLSAEDRTTLLDYLRAGGAWTGAPGQVAEKTTGLVHLITASGAYQFV